MAYDPSKMSDDELTQAILNKQNLAANRAKADPSKMTDDELTQAILAKQSGSVPTDMTQGGVVEEPSDVGIIDRALVQNFGGKLEDKLDYLKKSRPDLEFSTQDDNIIAKKPSEKQWKKLDPEYLGDGSLFSKGKEFLSDAVDSGYDLISSVPQAAATSAGAISGGGVASVPLAMAASGASSAASEALRQGIGNLVGTSKGLDTDTIKTSAIYGSLLPKIFGTGVSAKTIEKGLSNSAVKKFMTSYGFGDIKEVTPEATKLIAETLAEKHKGMLYKLPSKTLSAFSGTPVETIENSLSQVPKDLLEEFADPNGAVKLSIDPEKPITYLGLSKYLEAQNKTSIPRDTAQKIAKAIKDRSSEIGSEIENDLKKSGATLNLDDMATPIMEAISKLKSKGAEGIDGLTEEVSALEELAAKYFSRKPSGNFVGPQIGQVDAMTAFRIKNSLAGIAGYLDSDLADSKTAPFAQQLKGVIQSTERKISDQIYEKIGDTGLRKKYRENMETMRELLPAFSTDRKAASILTNLNSKANRNVKESLKKFDKQYGTNIYDRSKAVDVWTRFGSPAFEPISSDQATSTGRVFRGGVLGGAVGSLLGIASGIPLAPYIAGVIGGSAGTVASSPAATAAQLRGAEGLKKFTKPVGKSINSFLQPVLDKLPEGNIKSQAIWNLLNSEINK